MILLLTILIAYSILITLVTLSLWRSRNQAWRENARNAGDWIRNVIELDSEIARLREQINWQWRNTGKAEI